MKTKDGTMIASSGNDIAKPLVALSSYKPRKRDNPSRYKCLEDLSMLAIWCLH